MKKFSFLTLGTCLWMTSSMADQQAITIYNGGYGVVRDTIPLRLKKGLNEASFSNVSSRLEPDSVVLRDLKEQKSFSIVEQSYRSDAVSQGLLLSLFEGKDIEFLVGEKKQKGKIIRSGYSLSGGNTEPLIEMDKQLRFGLPGTPLFPSLSDQAILKPSLSWKLQSKDSQDIQAELSYITQGLSWSATYNVVSQPKGSTLDLTGWMTIDNQSGLLFNSANVKLMAGDVSKLAPQANMAVMARGMMKAEMDMTSPQVSEKSFDEFHLYSIFHPVTLRDHEIKQIEFVRSQNIKSETAYIYDGAFIDPNRYYGWNFENIRNDPAYGTESNTKVFVYKEFKNTKENQLGIPFPKGKIKFYTRDDDGRLEFTGENSIDHTQENETFKLYTGNAFDIKGERVRTDYKADLNQRWMEESFEIVLKNQKKNDVSIKVVEHMYRSINWKVTNSSMKFVKKDAQTAEFLIPVVAQKDKKITYTVRYSW